MADYIKKFEEHDDYTTYESGGTMVLPNISRCDDEKDIHYNPALLKYPMTFKVLSKGNIVFTATDANNTRTLSYSKNDGPWTEITSSTAGTEIPVELGDEVAFKGNNTNGLSYWNGSSGSQSVEYFNSFQGTTCYFHLYGNVMSLIEPTNFATSYEFKSNTYQQLGELFRNTKVISARHLLFPANTVGVYAYFNLFRGSTLISPPRLAAMNLSQASYVQVFCECKSLKKYPYNLPATNAPQNVYNNMFSETGLIEAPEIMATTISSNSF